MACGSRPLRFLGWGIIEYITTIFYCICLLADGEIDPPDNPTVSGGNLCDQDFYELRASCLEAGELFTDPEFPPDDQSLYFSQDPPFAVEWKRASEISDDPRLFEGGASRFDINQVQNCLFGRAMDAVVRSVRDYIMIIILITICSHYRASWETAGCWLH